VAAYCRPDLDIDKKVATGDNLLFVALDEGEVIGTIMAGYDGHRGWIYRMCTSAVRRREGIGSRLMEHAERALADRGCIKINLQVVEGNDVALQFYSSLGYSVEPRVSMGKRLTMNLPKS
jgi:GNAT superfamily N-acetyltransferase